MPTPNNPKLLEIAGPSPNGMLKEEEEEEERY